MAPRKPESAAGLEASLVAASKPVPASGRVLPTASRGSAPKAWGPPKRSVRGLAGDAMASNIAQLKEMGFGEEEARQALTECVWDVNKALDLLVTRAAAASSDERACNKDASVAACASGLQVPGPAVFHSVKTGDAATRATDSENSTTASAASSPRSSWRSVSGGSPQQVESHQAHEASPPLHLKEAPQKPIRRVSHPWGSQEEAHLRAEQGSFVRVWPSTETELGWIYAEDRLDPTVSGWLPVAVLDPLSRDECWMVAEKTMAAVHDSQLSVKEGDLLKVQPSSRTEEGWVYASGLCDSTGAGASTVSTQAGWVPVCSLCWEKAEE